jgi:hypothetical protein
MTVFGWDASDFDWDRAGYDGLNLGAARAAGISFVTHKSTEHGQGGVTLHRHFGEFIRRAKAAGMPFYGTYIVPRSGIAVQTQLNTNQAYLDQQVPGWRSDPKFFVQVDLEKWPYDSVADEIGEDMVRRIRSQYKKQALLYGSRGQYGGTIDADMPKWNAHYPDNRAMEFKALYRAIGGDSGVGWTPYGAANTPALIWQYTSRATIGAHSTCDANAFRGSLDDFAHLVGSDTSPPIAQTPRDQLAYPGDGHPIEIWDGVVLDDVSRRIIERAEYYPDKRYLYVTSSLRKDPGSYHNQTPPRLYHGKVCRGVDFGFGGVTPTGSARGRDFAKWLYDNFWDLTVQLIHTTPYADDDGFYVLDQVQRPGGAVYGAQTMAQHANHVHDATTYDLASVAVAKLESLRAAVEAVPAPIEEGEDMALPPQPFHLFREKDDTSASYVTVDYVTGYREVSGEKYNDLFNVLWRAGYRDGQLTEVVDTGSVARGSFGPLLP